MTLQTWLAFAATETVLCLVPGPAVLFVVSAALARGARPGLAAALGILAGNAFYFALSATSIVGVKNRAARRPPLSVGCATGGRTEVIRARR